MGTTVNHPEIAVRDTPTATQERKSATTKLHEKKSNWLSLSLSLFFFCTLILVKLKFKLPYHINYQLLWLKILSQRDVVAVLLFWTSIRCKWLTGRKNSLASCTAPLFDSNLVAIFFNWLSVGNPDITTRNTLQTYNAQHTHTIWK